MRSLVILCLILSSPGLGGCSGSSLEYITFPDASASDPSHSEGLPCPVADLLAQHCLFCHGAPPTNGAPISLVTYADLMAPSGVDPTKTVAQRALVRMQAGTMPPSGALSAGTIAPFQDWVNAGTPRGSCASPDGGFGHHGDMTQVGTCTSGQFWTTGMPSQLMHPGLACLACHAAHNGPMLAVAGTVYPSLHEADNCLSTSVTGAQVQITDANNVVTMVPVNANGNFLIMGMDAVAKPYTAQVLYQGRVRQMIPMQTSGDCNGCHTEAGANGAPGRIMVP